MARSLTWAPVALTLAAGLTLPAPARAQTPSNASYSVQVSDFGLPTQILTTPGALSLGSASASLRVAPDVLLQASASGTPNVSFGAAAGARLDYSFNIIGPAASTVPLLIFTSLFASAGGDPRDSRGQALAEFRVTTAIDQRYVFSSCDNLDAGGCANPAFSGGVAVRAAPNFLNYISLSVSTGGQNGGYGIATADPWITFDPSFANAGAYRIVLSPGVANDAAPTATVAPEPATFALLLPGLALLGLAARRRMRQG